MSNKNSISDLQDWKTARHIKMGQQIFKTLKDRLSSFFSEWFLLFKRKLLLARSANYFKILVANMLWKENKIHLKMKFFYFITVNILIIPQKPLIYKASL